MSHFIFWTLGFALLWAGLNLFDDEIVFIVTAIVGSAFVLIGLVTSPPQLQLVVEIGLVLALFNVCTQCIKRGDRS
jgi:hypothetical protein